MSKEATGGKLRAGGQLVVDALPAHGERRLFGVPGESYPPILDALYDVAGLLDMVTCRHEHGAAMMAEAHGKLTGEPGICLVTRGRRLQRAVGVHTAFQDSAPMLLLVGQVARPFLGREAFQEAHFTAMFRPLAYASLRRRSARATRSTHMCALSERRTVSVPGLGRAGGRATQRHAAPPADRE